MLSMSRKVNLIFNLNLQFQHNMKFSIYKSYFSLLFFTTLLFTACKKENNNLPAPTHNGGNVVACKINGKKFVVSGKTSSSNPIGVSLVGDGEGWIILANDGSSNLFFGF